MKGINSMRSIMERTKTSLRSINSTSMLESRLLCSSSLWLFLSYTNASRKRAKDKKLKMKSENIAGGNFLKTETTCSLLIWTLSGRWIWVIRTEILGSKPQLILLEMLQLIWTSRSRTREKTNIDTVFNGSSSSTVRAILMLLIILPT